MTDTSTDLAVAAPVPTLWDSSWRLSQRIAMTPFVPSAFRGKPESVLACVLYGNELGLGPMQALSSIHVIEGKPAASPELMRALIARAGHRIDVIEASDERVTLHGVRRDTGAEATVTWTMADAERAGLLRKGDKPGSWEKYPRAMLLARATSELARMIFSDVTMGLSYTPEEAAAVAGTDWDAAPLVDPVDGREVASDGAEFSPDPRTGREAPSGDESDIVDAEVIDTTAADEAALAVTPLPVAPLNHVEDLFASIIKSPPAVREALAKWRGNRPTTVKEMTKDPKWFKAVEAEWGRLFTEHLAAEGDSDG